MAQNQTMTIDNNTHTDPQTTTKALTGAAIFDDPDADITLLSSDGHETKVHSYLLRLESTVFRGILSDKNFFNDHSPLSFEAEVSDIRSLIYHMDAKDPTLGSLEQSSRLLELCDRYGLYKVEERIRKRMVDLVPQRPWEGFVLASQLDDITLAKSALRSMNKQAHAQSFDLSLTFIKKEVAVQPTVPYLNGLLRAAGNPDRYMGTDSRDWSKIADQFEPLLNSFQETK
ncbi:hypothetical protein V865_007221 [Kwoniella europaea PYCC6329]|uniref:BTB domain-containing protein n=1 Tax=Kwoniella europaea PYCC6329 TaxID=1423913 RepID=A0AAX4KRH8_9TREE